MPLDQQQLEQFHRDGYILVPDLFDANTMDAALEAVDLAVYGRKFVSVLEDADNGVVEDENDVFTGEGNAGRSQFPTGVDVLDRLFENEEYLDIFEQLLGDRAAYCNAHLFVRSGPNDTRHAEHPWQGYHVDHDTNSFLPPSTTLNTYSYINSGVYLHDVDDDGAPMHVIPGSHRQVGGIISRLIEEGIWSGPNTIDDIRRIPEFTTPVPATGSKGSVFFGSSYLVHAAVPFQNKRKQRSIWTMSCGRRDTLPFVRFSNVYDYTERTIAGAFFASTTPRVRSIFGWPEPGDPYYTEQTLPLIEAWFPGIDVTPYREALRHD